MDFKDDNIIIFSGSGNLSLNVYDTLQANNKYIVGFDNYYNGNIVPYKTTAYTDFENIINICNELKCNKIFLLGGIDVKDFLQKENEDKDWKYKNYFVGDDRGDDFLLTKIIQLLKDNAIEVLSVDDVNNFNKMKKGQVGKYGPCEKSWIDINRASKILDNQSDLDIGQTIIVQNQVVLSIEAVEGTDNCIKRTKDFVIKNCGVSPTLVKKVKLNQSRKCDIPTIGIQTFINCFDSGVMGVCVSADDIIFLDQDEVIEFIDKNKMFLVGI